MARRELRTSRLLTILISLQLGGRVSARALAEKLEVSKGTIYRDIDELSAAGIPVYADRGRDSGFTLLDTFRTQITGLSSGESEALLLAGIPLVAAGLSSAALRTAYAPSCSPASATAPRTFRLSAVRNATLWDEPFERPREFNLAEHWSKAIARFEKGLRREEARLRAAPTSLDCIDRLGADIAEPLLAAAPGAHGGARRLFPSKA